MKTLEERREIFKKFRERIDNAIKEAPIQLPEIQGFSKIKKFKEEKEEIKVQPIEKENVWEL